MVVLFGMLFVSKLSSPLAATLSVYFTKILIKAHIARSYWLLCSSLLDQVRMTIALLSSLQNCKNAFQVIGFVSGW